MLLVEAHSASSARLASDPVTPSAADHAEETEEPTPASLGQWAELRHTSLPAELAVECRVQSGERLRGSLQSYLYRRGFSGRALQRNTGRSLDLLGGLLLWCPASLGHLLDLDISPQLHLLSHDWPHVERLGG